MTTDQMDTAATTEAAETYTAKFWAFREVLREDGLSTAEYLELLAFLFLLRILDDTYQADVRLRQWNSRHPEPSRWRSFRDALPDDLAQHLQHAVDSLDATLEELGIGKIVSGTRVAPCPPARLIRLADLIEEIWPVRPAGTDIVGNVYERLMALAAAEGKGEIGQLFTPRALVDAMVAVTLPTWRDTVMDPACGTGGFLVAARAHARQHAAESLASGRGAFELQIVVRGVELVPLAARLAATNLLLHGPTAAEDEPTIRIGNALTSLPGEVSLVLTHPPFGVRSPITVHAAGDSLSWDRLLHDRHALSHSRRDFVSSTVNRPLKFLQHVTSLLKPGGRAAVIVPDNVLFTAGDGETVRRHLLANFNVHTLLRLPAGAVVPGGLRSNVMFFDRPAQSQRGTPSTRQLWVYDLRFERPSRTKCAALQRDDFDDFVACYLPGQEPDERTETERFKAFAYEDLIARDTVNLDLSWAEDSTEDVYRPAHVIAQEIVNDLGVALSEFSAIADTLRARHVESDDGW